MQPTREQPSDQPPGAPEPAPRQVDLLTLGLAVFFVSLIAIVAALLILPAIF
jgi:hypothetical protein